MPSKRKNEVVQICMRSLFDVCWILAGFTAAVYLTHTGAGSWYLDFPQRAVYGALFLAVWCWVAFDQRLFISSRSETMKMALSRMGKAVGISLLFTGFLMVLLTRNNIDRTFLIAFALCLVVSAEGFTAALRPSVWNLRRRGYNTRRIVFIGANERTARLFEVLLNNEHYGFRIDGYLEDDVERCALLEKYGVPYLGKIQELENLLTQQVIDGVYIALPIRSHYETIESIVHLCEGIGVPVRLAAELFPLKIATSSLTRLADIPLLSMRRRGAKRLFARKTEGAPGISKPRSLFSTAGVALLDGVALLCAYLCAVVITAVDTAIIPYSLINNLPNFLVFMGVWCMMAVEQELWTTRPGEALEPYLMAVGKAIGNALILCVVVMALAAPDFLANEFLVTFCFGALILLPAFRVALRRILLEFRRRGWGSQRVVIAGVNERTKRLAEAIRSTGLTVAGVVDDDPERANEFPESGLPYLGNIASLRTTLASGEIQRVYVTLPMRSHYESIQQVLECCEERNVSCYLVVDLLPLHIATSDTMMVEDIPLLSLSPICEAYGKLALKRIIDFLGSSALILGLSPVFLITSLLIKLESKGPVFFAQVRVGQNQRLFKIIKFRSMVINAEELKKALEAQNEADGPVFKIKRDPRITRVGRYIRKFSIDELPQLFNVWMGEMSLVGPRPPLPNEVAQYGWNQRRRLSVKPGMTGLWQVSGRSDLPFHKWVELDLAYIDTWSIVQDFIILLKTFKVVFTGRGAA